MTLDQKFAEVTLKPSSVLLRWIIIAHILSVLAVLFLWFSLGLDPIMTLVLLTLVTLGFFYSYREYKTSPWHKIIFDDGQWGLTPNGSHFDCSAMPALNVRLCHYYRFGNSWILSFCRLDRSFLQTRLQGRTTILLLPDGCEKDGLRRMGQILTMKNRLLSDKA